MRQARWCAALLALVMLLTAVSPAVLAEGLVENAGGGSGWDIIEYPTCTKPGKQVRYTVTGTYEEETIPPTGHKYGPWTQISEATCKERAKQAHTCTVCGGGYQWQYFGDYGPHKWGEWMKVRDPSPELPGLRQRVCGVCGLVEEEEIPYESDPVPPEYGELSITLDATVSVPGPYYVNDVVTILLTVRNTSGQTLHFTTAFNDPVESYPPTLAPDESWTGTYPYTVTEESLENIKESGMLLPIEFWVTYENDTGDSFATDSAQVELDIQETQAFEPLLVLSGAGGPDAPLKLGSEFEVMLTALNVGNVDVDLDNFNAAGGENDNYDGWLLLSQSWLPPEGAATFPHRIIVSPADVSIGKVIRDFTIDYSWDEQKMITNSVHVEFPLEAQPVPPAVTVIKSAQNPPQNGMYYVEGEVIHYVFTVTNQSDMTFDGGILIDPLFWTQETGDLILTVPSLGPWETVTASADYTVTAADVCNGFIANQATFRGTYLREQYWYPSNTVLVPTGEPNTSLTIVKDEISSPKHDGKYRLDEVIDYEITVKNTGNTVLYNVIISDLLKLDDNVVQSIAELHPSEKFIAYFSHTVTPFDVSMEEVINFALVDYQFGPGYNPGPTLWADPVISLVEGENNEDQFPLPGESCVRTLTADGVTAAEYDLALCPAHAAVAKNAAALTDAAQTEAERKDAWQQVEELWLQAVNDLYSECLLAASQEHRVMLVRNQYAFQSYLNAYEKALKTAYGLDGQAVCERLCAALTARVVDLCYVAHHAPERRPDSLLSGSVRPLTADAAARCALVRGKAAANRFTSTETLCESHVAPEEALRQALSLAAGADAQADAFGNAESAYRNLISALATALGRSLPRQAQRELMMYGSAAGSFLDAENDTLLFFYPDNPEIRAEILCREAREMLIVLCSK